MNLHPPRRTLRRTAWRICLALAALLVALSLSPWVLAPGRIEPVLLGLPRTLWAGLAIAAALVAVALVGAFVHPGGDGAAD